MSKLSTKGQVVIPARIRESLSLEPGVALYWDVVEDKGKKKITADPVVGDFTSLYGSLKSPFKKPLSWKKVQRRAHEAAAKHIAKAGL